MDMAMDFVSNIQDVITPMAISYAVASGTVLGVFFLWVTLKRPPLTYLSPVKAALFSVGVLGILGTVFFAGQITQSMVEGVNPNEPARVFARYLLWMIFSSAIAITHTFAISFARRNPKESPANSMETRLNDRADLRANAVKQELLTETFANRGLKGIATDTRRRVKNIQERITK